MRKDSGFKDWIMKFNWACRCGDHWHGSVPKQALEALRREWNSQHVYFGHEKHGHHECTPAEAGRSRHRRKADARQLSGERSANQES
jgi:hypothetical protein